jgi:hypothetical protein
VVFAAGCADCGEFEAGEWRAGDCGSAPDLLACGGPVGANGADPFDGHDLMSGVGGMHAVPDPGVGGCAPRGVIEGGLEMNDGGVIFAAECFHHDDALIEFGAVSFPVRLFRPNRQAEGLTEDDADLWQGVGGVSEEVVVTGFKVGSGDAGGEVVDADEDAEEVGFERDLIGLPALCEVGDAIPTDAAIEKGEAAFGELRAEFGGDDELVSVAENMIWVFGAAAVAIGNRVSLEEDSGAGPKNRHRIRRGCGISPRTDGEE